jgi:GR25 family glycosyltransferase involved in LPS biosynthesis
MYNNVLNKFNIMNYRFNAFDGKYIDDIKSKYFISTDNIYPTYSNAEYATLLSHLTSIDLYCNSFNNCLYNYGLICEDDLSLEFVKYWNVDLKHIIEELKDFDILMLGYFSLDINHTQIYNNWTGTQWSCMAYIVNKNTVKEKIKELKIDGKWKCNKDDLMIADNYIYSKFKTYYYKYPYFCNPSNNDSNIHEDHLDYHIMYKNMNYLTLNKVYDEYIVDL